MARDQGRSNNSNAIQRYAISKNKSEKRDSNPRPPPWQGDALPLSYFRNLKELHIFKDAGANLIQFYKKQRNLLKKQIKL